MKKISAIATLRDAPERKLVYRDAGNGILFIGTHHDSLKIIPKTEVDKLKDRVEDMDLLFFEGPRSLFSLESASEQSIRRGMIEWVAYNHHKGESVFLDDLKPASWIDMAKKYGMRPFLSASLLAHQAVLDTVRVGARSGGDMYGNAIVHLDSLRRRYPSMFTNNNSERSAAAATEAVIRCENAFGSINPARELDRTFLDFLVLVRDKEVYGPLISKHVANAPGSRGVVIGSKHIDNLVRVLGGQGLDVQDWSAYVDKMGEEARGALQLLKDAASRIGV
jgi:hypothetical protein